MYVLMCGLQSSRLGLRITATSNSSGKNKRKSPEQKKIPWHNKKYSYTTADTKEKKFFFHIGDTLTNF